MKNLYSYGELYHDYSIFGVKNIQIPGIFNLNQKCKMHILTAYIQYAIAKSKVNSYDEVSFVELFCADGYYTMLSKHLGATKAVGIDNNKDKFFTNSSNIAKDLELENIEFYKEDVNNIDKFNKFDIVANIGGLYHVSNPIEIIIKSYNMSNKFLIIQTVVSLENDDENYFQSPAPGWDWGSRFNRKSFDKIIKGLGYNVIDQHFNELEGNDKLSDRGSLYYLISKLS